MYSYQHSKPNRITTGELHGIVPVVAFGWREQPPISIGEKEGKGSDRLLRHFARLLFGTARLAAIAAAFGGGALLPIVLVLETLLAGEGDHRVEEGQQDGGGQQGDRAGIDAALDGKDLGILLFDDSVGNHLGEEGVQILDVGVEHVVRDGPELPEE